jgi:hypothetical protein
MNGASASARAEDSWVRRGSRRLVRWARAPEYRKLRWILLAGLLVRLVLAPLTSWAVDTPGFILSGLSALYYGNPYDSTTWFNPPLGPFLAAPFLSIPAAILGPQTLFPVISAITPMVEVTGADASVVPVPAALLAWKLPLILSDLGVALLLWRLMGRYGPTRPVSRELVVAAWFLNPLVIWASSVHGEVDTLAALFTLGALAMLAGRQWWLAGLLLGLGILSKGYPVALVPLAATAALFGAPGGWQLRARLRDLGLLAAGLAVSLLAFFPFLVDVLGSLELKAESTIFGGISVLAIFNSASPRGTSGAYFEFTTQPSNAVAILSVFRGLEIVAIGAGVLLLAYHLRRGPSTDDAGRLRWLALAVLWALAGLLLAESVPEPEYLIALFAPLLLVMPGARWAAPMLALLSACGIALYWAFLTPFAMFYPLAVDLGPPAIRWVNAMAIGFATTPLVRGAIWLTIGLIGGTTLILLWALAARAMLPQWIRRWVRERFRSRGGTSAPVVP